jgi:hypothetical protein
VLEESAKAIEEAHAFTSNQSCTDARAARKSARLDVLLCSFFNADACACLNPVTSWIELIAAGGGCPTKKRVQLLAQESFFVGDGIALIPNVLERRALFYVPE